MIDSNGAWFDTTDLDHIPTPEDLTTLAARRERFVWQPGDVQVDDAYCWKPGDPINLRHCVAVPGPDPACQVHGEACAELWGELEDGRVDQLLEEAAFDVGLGDNDGFYWSDPDR